MAPDLENARGKQAAATLQKRNSYNLDSLIAAANDPHLQMFDVLIPALAEAAYNTPNVSKDTRSVAKMLELWDKNRGINSIPTAVAVTWGEELIAIARPRLTHQQLSTMTMEEWLLTTTTAAEKVQALDSALADLSARFGNWQTPWGVVNRYQRLTGDIVGRFDDTRPSIPVGMTPSVWGSLAAYGSRQYEGTQKRYGYRGNSFVAVVSFGEKLKARAIVSGGQSGDPRSPHFTDQAKDFCANQFRDVYFYRTEVEAAAEKRYNPGEK
ncbi:MAG: penicillin acylase family protein [Saprospiraceae bacterium]